MDFALYTLARCLHVAAIVGWIGGVWLVTLVVMPAISRSEAPAVRLAAFHRIEQGFAPQARFWVLLAGASGSWMTHQADLWSRFTDPDNWREILRAWLLGQPLAQLGAGDPSATLQFVEGGLVYRLPWAMEAIRVRGIGNGDAIGDFALDDFDLGSSLAAVETGTVNRSAAILIHAGFTSRLAAIKAVKRR